MNPYRIKVKLLLTFSGLLSIICFSIVLLVWHSVNAEKLGEILLHYGFIILPISVFWWLLEKYCWHWTIIQNVRSVLNIPPDFRGRWQGTLHRDGEVSSHDFVIEIKQTLSKIWVYTYSSRSSSQSQIAEISCDDSEDNFKVCYLWQGEGGHIGERSIQKSIFNGYTILSLNEVDDPKKLSGFYFTNREPQTKGKIELSWVSLQTLKKY